MFSLLFPCSLLLAREIERLPPQQKKRITVTFLAVTALISANRNQKESILLVTTVPTKGHRTPLLRAHPMAHEGAKSLDIPPSSSEEVTQETRKRQDFGTTQNLKPIYPQANPQHFLQFCSNLCRWQDWPKVVSLSCSLAFPNKNNPKTFSKILDRSFASPPARGRWILFTYRRIEWRNTVCCQEVSFPVKSTKH